MFNVMCLINTYGRLIQFYEIVIGLLLLIELKKNAGIKHISGTIRKKKNCFMTYLLQLYLY